MKRWKALALVCVVALCCSAVLAGCSTQKYTPSAKSQTISDSALITSGTLTVGVNASAAPLAGQTSSSSDIVGIDVDVASAIADELGLKVKIVDVGNDPEGALKEKRVDVVLGIDSSTSTTSYWRSSTYLESGVALFASSSSVEVPKIDSKPTIAAQSSSKSSWRVTNLFGDTSLSSQSDLKSAFSALSNKKVTYVASDAVIGTYVAHTSGISASIIALLQNASGYCAGVSTSNTDLQKAVTTALKSITTGGEMDAIEGKWLGTTIDLSKTTVISSTTSTESALQSSSTTTTTTTTTTTE